MIPFRLRPSTPSPKTDRLALGGVCGRKSDWLCLRYELVGNLTAIALPQRFEVPQRRDNLWQETCFEFFIGVEGDRSYWEFNLSPTGDWNCYRFSDYRQDMKPEMALDALPFSSEQGSDRFYLELELNLACLGLAEKRLEIGITAVIEERSASTRYWAMTHTGKEADFHRRDSFTLRLD
jgi:hypothetical protein